MCSLTHNDLKRIFEKLDKNGDGLVSLDELNWLLDKTGGSSTSLQELEEHVVGKKSLNLDEFLFFYDSILKINDNGDNKGEVEEVESDLAKAFEVFDLNGDGFISSQELECVLKRLGLLEQQSGNKDCRAMILSYDTNLDGQLDFEEFKNMMMLSTS
ncbi:probable calcium-binding protein CML44 [Arachis stenosperma]|uniref:probable calcium-binding protein CML44 n=1 Tax=Arachis stenosperma TaxID=217475 RepID=UPI0025AC50C5|nr:probable calcium-binding protein CML44 [Arachis stenosperma]